MALVILLALGLAKQARGDKVVPHETPVVAVKPVPTHAQEVWIAALEWCESRGVNGAINPKDLDGTPSYGAFQFKPSTLTYFAKIYGVTASSTVMDYTVQHALLEAMVLDRNHIEWGNQFPTCVKLLGYPPKSGTV